MNIHSSSWYHLSASGHDVSSWALPPSRGQRLCPASKCRDMSDNVGQTCCQNMSLRPSMKGIWWTCSVRGVSQSRFRDDTILGHLVSWPIISSSHETYYMYVLRRLLHIFICYIRTSVCVFSPKRPISHIPQKAHSCLESRLEIIISWGLFSRQSQISSKA
jgi:hypothetical protein